MLLRDRGLRQTTPGDTAESLLRGAAASARLDGSTTSLADLRDSEGDDIAVAAAASTAELLTMVPVLTRSPLQALARMHLLAAPRGPDRGRPRPEPGVADQLQALGRAIVGRTEVPGAVLAAVCHAELMRVAPFAAGNGLVARALERLLLVARGVDPASVLVPEAGHLALGRDSYDAALRSYAQTDRQGVSSWLTHAAAALGAATSASPLADPR